MQNFVIALAFMLAACGSNGQIPVAKQSFTGTDQDRKSLNKTTDAIRDAFSRGDIDAILALHHPEVVKYFGGNNIVVGREGLRKQVSAWLGDNRVKFVENTVESTIFTGETAIETSIFAIRNEPKNGGSPVVIRGRTMVVFIKYPNSPTGWVSIREITQEAPAQ